ncbi:MAG: hypothetical protein ACKOFG_15920 [Limnohabitans sp.]
MGFGSKLAGGCAVGAGVTGGALFALTAGSRCSGCGQVRDSRTAGSMARHPFELRKNTARHWHLDPTPEG